MKASQNLHQYFGVDFQYSDIVDRGIARCEYAASKSYRDGLLASAVLRDWTKSRRKMRGKFSRECRAGFPYIFSKLHEICASTHSNLAEALAG